jgi:2-keto-4-pentenoate hydratase
MTPAQIGESAALLAAARESITRLTLPAELKPQNTSDMYAVQKRVVDYLGGRGGFKAGLASPQMKPVEGMIYSGLASKNIVPNGARLTVPASGLVGFETEIAFRLGRDLPARAQGYSEAEIRESVGEVLPVIEVAWSRFDDLSEEVQAELLPPL